MAAKFRSKNRCAVPGCIVPVARRYLMCARHWFLVPAALRQEVNEAWGIFQGSGHGKDRYLEVRERAVTAVQGMTREASNMA